MRIIARPVSRKQMHFIMAQLIFPQVFFSCAANDVANDARNSCRRSP